MELKLACKQRTETGKNAAGRLRRAGMVPANVISNGKTRPISVAYSDLAKLLNGGLRPSTLLDLEIEGSGNARVFVKELQRNPLNSLPLHVDFFEVTPGKKVLVTVAVEYSGLSKGVKLGGALEHFIRTLKVKTTPESLKDVVKVDITNLDVGEAVHVSDLGLPADWELRMHGNPVVLKVSRSRMSRAEEGEETPAAAADKAAS